ncbi:MAG TPA: YfhO family protein, partial [Anaerolineae bacterium]|nr:YfhO family protein [Anaerolineae bacterium]
SGQLGPPVLHGKVEAEDDKRFAGVPWEAMTDVFLFNLVRHFNVTLIATTPTDIKARAFLDGASQFKPAWSNSLFTLYDVSDYEPAWAEAERAAATVTRYDRTVIDVEITDAAPNATLLVKVAYFPRWRAEMNGQPLPIQMSDYGLISIDLPPGSYTVNLRYGPAWPERLGGMISLATVLLALGSLFKGSIQVFGQ